MPFWGRWKLAAIAIGFALLIPVPLLVADLLTNNERVGCKGKVNGGSVSGAQRMPVSGANFAAYCRACVLALRTYGHRDAIATALDAYDAMHDKRPETQFVYGEIGFPWGGRFRPHRTHRNGLSFDFMVPLRQGSLKTTVFNRFGYDEKFDADGNGASGQIDFAAIVDHITALRNAATERGGEISLIVFAPDLQNKLRNVAKGSLTSVRFNSRPSWVRHDDHYHVDFSFPCS